jgi:hypothetical protein
MKRNDRTVVGGVKELYDDCAEKTGRCVIASIERHARKYSAFNPRWFPRTRVRARRHPEDGSGGERKKYINK